MPNDNINANGGRRVLPDPTKFHKDAPAPGSTADAVKQDTQPSEGQPEIPKVGSRDAPGG